MVKLLELSLLSVVVVEDFPNNVGNDTACLVSQFEINQNNQNFTSILALFDTCRQDIIDVN